MMTCAEQMKKIMSGEVRCDTFTLGGGYNIQLKKGKQRLGYLLNNDGGYLELDNYEDAVEFINILKGEY